MQRVIQRWWSRTALLLVAAAIVPACGGSSGGGGGAGGGGGGGGALPIGPSPGGAPASTPGAGSGTAGAAGSTYEGPGPTNANLRDIFFFDANVGFAVGDNGVIIATTDGGDTWTVQDSGVTENLRAVFFRTALIGWAVGDATLDGLTGLYTPTVLATTDGGATWAQPAGVPPVTTSLPYSSGYDVKFIDASAGWISMGLRYVLRTVDGGVNWTVVDTGNSVWLGSLDAYDTDATPADGDEVVYVVGISNWLLRSTDGGASFGLFSFTPGTTYQIQVVSAGTVGDLADDDLIIVGSMTNRAAWSTNSGTSWTNAATMPANTPTLFSVSILPGTDDGWAVGDSQQNSITGEWHRTIRYTADGGVTWVSQDGGTDPAPRDLFSVSAFSATNAWAGGEFGLILHFGDNDSDVMTPDDWAEQSDGSSVADLNDVAMGDANTAWAVGANGTVLKTVTGGDTWVAQDSNVTQGLNAVSATDTSHVWAVGGQGTIIHTSDGGATWGTQASGVTEQLLDVDFFNDNFGVAVGHKGTILRTENGGTTWTNVSDLTLTDKHLRAVDFVDTKRGFAMGQNGILLVSSDGGETWDAVNNVPTNAPLSDISFTGWKLGYLIGGGSVFKTIDGGNGWTEQTLPAMAGGPNCIKFVDDFHGYIGTDQGEILMTIDGGTTWTVLSQVTGLPLSGIDFASVTVGVAVGQAGTIVTCP